MKNEGDSSLWPEIPFDFEGIGVLLNLARAFMPGFSLPTLVSQPPRVAGATEEVRVRNAEARYQALVEQIPAVSFMASFENGHSEIYVSPHIETLLGYTAREWIDDPILWYQRLHPGDKARWNKEFCRTVSLAEPFKADYRFLAKDGRVVWIHGEAKVVRDESGQPMFFQGLGYDITELKNAEEVLRRSREELEEMVKARTAELSALKSALDEHAIVAITDPRGRITYVNDKFCSISKYNRAELLGQDHRIVNSGLHPKEYFRDLWNTILQGRVWKGEMRNRAKDGTFYWVDMTIVPFLDPKGKLYQFVAIRADITERKLAEDAVKQSLEEKETLLKEIHHRVKNNMQLIASLLRLQSAYITDPAALDVFRDLQNRIRTMALIHERLYQSPSLAKIDFAEYIRSLVAMLAEIYHKQCHSISVETNLEPASLTLETAIPVGLILNELVSNCFKHAFPDGRAGVVRVGLKEADGGFELSIRDNGVGLPAGFECRKCSSLGMRLIRVLTEQIGGKLDVSFDGGTVVRLTVAGDPAAA